jgi:hypothetical protein
MMKHDCFVLRRHGGGAVSKQSSCGSMSISADPLLRKALTIR